MAQKSRIFIGMRVGKLTVIEDLGLQHRDGVKHKWHYYKCKCDCGNVIDVIGPSITGGKSKSCGKCYQRELLNKRFGSLVVKSVYSDNGLVHCVCKCDCGNDHIDVYAGNLLSGKSTSCGRCTGFGLVGKRLGHLTVLKYYPAGTINDNKTALVEVECDCGNVILKNAGTCTPGSTYIAETCNQCYNHSGWPNSYLPEVKEKCRWLSSVYDGVVERTSNPLSTEFYRYGGRGIGNHFKDRYEFIHTYYDKDDIYQGLQIDRIDNNKGYSVDNVRFVTHLTNVNNTVVQLENTYETIAKRLLTATAFSNALARNKWYRDQFVPISFTEHNFPERPLWLFIHKSLLDDLDYYVKRIKGFYDKFNGGLTIEDYPDIKLSMKLVELIKDNCKRNSVYIKSFKMFQIVYETVKLDHPEFDDLGNIKFIYDKLLNL